MGREPWKSKTVLLASREGCERTERERAWEALVTGRAGPPPLPPPLRKGGKRAQRNRDEAQLVQDQLFTNPALHWPTMLKSWSPVSRALLCLASSMVEKMGNENHVTKAWLER